MKRAIIDRVILIADLTAKQSKIHHESDSDEGAMEYWAELESIIVTARDPNASDEDVIKAAEWVGENISRYLRGA